MLVVKIVFWISLFMLFYIYLGYPFILKLLTNFKRKEIPNIPKQSQFISISIVITVHNEQDLIERRILNCLNLDYPTELVEIIIASDGSTDRTNQIVRSLMTDHPNIRLIAIQAQKGRAFTLNHVIEFVKNDIVLFTDANTIFKQDYLSEIIKKFNDPEVGCVGGQLTYLNNDNNTITQNESLYWNLEAKIRQYESQLGILTSVSGCNFAIRRELFTPISLVHEIDDIYPYRAIKAGYKVVHQQHAKAFEESPETIAHQLYARERIIIQGLPGIWSEIRSSFFIKKPQFLFSVISHRFLRWMSPILLLILFISNLFLSNVFLYRFVLLLQISSMVFAFIGFYLNRHQKKVRIIGSLFAFYLANIGFLLGMTKLMNKVRMQKY